MTRGIDVSTYQRNVDYKKVKADGIDFVIIRAGYGKDISQKDREFERHYANAKAAGLGVGAYWYSYATSIADAKKEAATCLQAIKGKRFEYPIFYDIEERRTFSTGMTNEIAREFLAQLETAGYFAGIYISRSPAQTYLYPSTRKRYALWLAEYSPRLHYDGQYGIWQYTGSGRVDGVNGDVDRDECYINYPKAIKAKGLNGYSKAAEAKPTAQPTSKIIEKSKSATDYKAGDAVTVSQANLYISARAEKSARKISGTFYIYDGEEINGRYRITTQKEFCGKQPAGNYVTGYIDTQAIK